VARRLWGCYSVADHLQERAFVADLLLYDRLVIPVPTPDDRQRWIDEKWNPERQAALLDILGGFAERIEWSMPLREQFAQEWTPSNAALDIDASPYGATRRIISEQLQAKVAKESDVRAVAVYTQPDRFDKEWKFTRRGSFLRMTETSARNRFARIVPFLRRVKRIEPGGLREAGRPQPAEQERRARLVVTRLVVPDGRRSDEEVLKQTVDLVSRDDVANRRSALHTLLAALITEGLRDETIIAELEDKLQAYNKAIRRRSEAQLTRMALQVFTTAEGAAGLWLPPVAVAAGPTAAIGEAGIQRRWGQSELSVSDLAAASLLADARQAVAVA